jgi:hypothetical protein
MRNADCGLRALNFGSSLLIPAHTEMIKEETKFRARIPNSAFRI